MWACVQISDGWKRSVGDDPDLRSGEFMQGSYTSHEGLSVMTDKVPMRAITDSSSMTTNRQALRPGSATVKRRRVRRPAPQVMVKEPLTTGSTRVRGDEGSPKPLDAGPEMSGPMAHKGTSLTGGGVWNTAGAGE